MEEHNTAVATVVIASEFGGPQVLQFASDLLGEPGPGEVIVAVKAIGVNRADALLRAGVFGGAPPVRLGVELSGIVTHIGDGVSRVHPGEEVIAFRAPGAYATALITPEAAIVPKPASLGWAEAAGLMAAGTTAWHALEATHVADGDVVLVHGAAGGVGQMVVQLAALRGARVVGTSSTGNASLLRELGAVPIEYGDGLLRRVHAQAPGKVTVALDLIGTAEALDVSLRLVPDRSRIATIVPSETAAKAGIRMLGGGPGAERGTEIRAAARTELARLAGDGLLRVRISKVLRLSEAVTAHELIETGHADGKLILIP